MFFVVALFSGDFEVPCSWDRADGCGTDVVWIMKNPSAVGLQKCEIAHKDGLDVLTMVNAVNDALLCCLTVTRFMKVLGCLLGLGLPQFLGCVERRRSLEGCICVVGPKGGLVEQCVSLAYMSGPANHCRWSVCGKRLLISKFFCNFCDGMDFCVSVAFHYEGLRSIDVLCGVGGEHWAKSGAK